MRLTLGIDEAGRGPVLGPMVLAAVCLDTKAARALARAGLRDSKAFGATAKAKSMRAELAGLVRELAVHVAEFVVEVAEIDPRVCAGELNALEREAAAKLIGGAPAADRIVADGERLFAPLAAQFAHLEAMNKAESKHAAVAAASVVAKHRRDELFAAIRRRYSAEFGDLHGGGYVNEATRRFLRAYAGKYGDLPPEARRSWPHDYLRDILGDDFDPRAGIKAAPAGPVSKAKNAAQDMDMDRTQLALFPAG
jgi:ribonuclease HII